MKQHALNNPLEHGRATYSTTWRTALCGCKRHTSCCSGERRVVESAAPEPVKPGWNNTSAQRKRLAPTVMMFRVITMVLSGIQARATSGARPPGRRGLLSAPVRLLTATCRVARLTLQTRKLWLVGVATDRDARFVCVSFHFLLLFLQAQKIKKKKKKRKIKKKKNKERGLQGALCRDGTKNDFFTKKKCYKKSCSN